MGPVSLSTIHHTGSSNGMLEWQILDSPFQQYSILSPTCIYVQHLKGKQFVLDNGENLRVLIRYLQWVLGVLKQCVCKASNGPLFIRTNIGSSGAAKSALVSMPLFFSRVCYYLCLKPPSSNGWVHR